jgi:hypothetical protein
MIGNKKLSPIPSNTAAKTLIRRIPTEKAGRYSATR